MEEKRVFGNKLKELRKEYGFTQARLATELGTTVKTISHWETDYSEPSLGQLVMIADLFDISVDELLDHK